MSSMADTHREDTGTAADGAQPEDAYGAAADAAEGRVYTVTGQDWDTIESQSWPVTV